MRVVERREVAPPSVSDSGPLPALIDIQIPTLATEEVPTALPQEGIVFEGSVVLNPESRALSRASEARRIAWDKRPSVTRIIFDDLAAGLLVATIVKRHPECSPKQVRNVREKARLRGLLPHPTAEATIKARSEAHRGQPSPFRGRNHSPNTIAKMRETRSGRLVKADTLIKRVETRSGRALGEDERAAIIQRVQVREAARAAESAKEQAWRSFLGSISQKDRTWMFTRARWKFGFSSEEAEDAAQKACVNTLSGQRPEEIPATEAKRTVWFARILDNVCIDTIRRRSAERRSLGRREEFVPHSAFSAGSNFPTERGALAGIKLRRVLDDPTTPREVLLFAWGYPLDEIARGEGKTVSAVKSTMYRWREKERANDNY